MWKRVGKETRDCIRGCWKKLLLFEILYRTTWYWGMGALLRMGLQQALKQKDYSYLTAENFETFMRYPGTILVFALGILIFLLTQLFELAALFSCLDWQRSGRGSLSLAGMVKGGVMRCEKLLRRSPFLWIPGIGLLCPLLCGIYLVEESSRIKFLNYFFQFLWNSVPPVMLVFLAGALLICAFFSVLSIPAAMKRGGSLFSRMRLSAGKIRENSLTAAFWLILCQIAVFSVMTLTYVLGSLVLAAYVRIWQPQEIALSVLLVMAEHLQGFCGVMAGGFGVALNGSLLYSLEECLCRPGRITAFAPGKEESGIWPRIAVAAMLAVSLVSFWQTCSTQVERVDSLYGGVQVTAHRGAAKTAPENTMSAMENAVNKLSDYVEIDVQETKDGVLVLLHDNNLKRTTGVNLDIWKVDYEVVRCLDAGSWFQEKYRGERIPTFEEVLEYCRGKLLINVEVKSNGHNGDIVEKVVQTIRDCDMVDQCVLTSMSYQFLREAKELEPDLRTGYIMAMAYGNVELLDYADFLSVKYTYVTEEFVKKAHACGKEVHVWTVNSRYNMKRMIMLNVDNLITDRPELAVQVLAEEAGQETYLELLRYILSR